MNNLLTVLLLVLHYQSSITEITSDLVESKEIEDILQQEEFALVMVYNTLTTENLIKCKKTMEDLERNFENKVSFFYSDLEEGEFLNSFFKLNNSSIKPDEIELKSCKWTLSVYGYSIPFHNQSDEFDVLSNWLSLRLQNTPKEITSSKEFYNATSQYFSGIYAYTPSNKETTDQINNNKNIVLNKMKALCAEFPSSKFFYSFDPKTHQEIKVTPTAHTFIMARSFEDGHKSVQADSNIELSKIRNYVKQYRYPFIMWWNQEIADFVEQEQQDIFLLIVRKRKNYQLEAAFERIARSYEGKGFRYAILEINGNKVTGPQKKMLEKLKIGPKSNIPTTIAIVNNPIDQTVKYINCDNMTETGMQSFIGSFHGEDLTSHCIKNQFLKKGWTFNYVKPINYDWLLSISTQVTPINQVVFFYRSHNKFDRPLTKRFFSLTKEASKLKTKTSNFYIFDYRLNEAPQYLIDANASVPGILVFSPDSVDNEGKYTPQYFGVNEYKDIYKVFDDVLKISSKKLMIKSKKNKEKI